MRRILVLALAATALAQPALARDQSPQQRRSAVSSGDPFGWNAPEATAYQRDRRTRRQRAADARYLRVAGTAPQDFAAPFGTPFAAGPGWEQPQRSARRASVRETHQQQSFPTPFAAPFAVQPGWEQPRTRTAREPAPSGALDGMIAQHASANGVPLELARRVVARESGGNPRAVSKGNYGLMQIRLGTARAMGYSGSGAGLLDPNVNMTYAMRYLGGAYRAAGGDPGRAIANYQRGYNHRGTVASGSPYAGSDAFAQQWPQQQQWQQPFGAFASAAAYSPDERTSPRRRARHRR